MKHFESHQTKTTMSKLIQEAVSRPYVILLGLATSAAVGGGLFMGYHFITSDPTLVVRNKRENPFPWKNLSQSTNIKLHAVKKTQFKDDVVKKSF